MAKTKLYPLSLSPSDSFRVSAAPRRGSSLSIASVLDRRNESDDDCSTKPSSPLLVERIEAGTDGEAVGL